MRTETIAAGAASDHHGGGCPNPIQQRPHRLELAVWGVDSRPNLIPSAWCAEAHAAAIRPEPPCFLGGSTPRLATPRYKDFGAHGTRVSLRDVRLPCLHNLRNATPHGPPPSWGALHHLHDRKRYKRNDPSRCDGATPPPVGLGCREAVQVPNAEARDECYALRGRHLQRADAAHRRERVQVGVHTKGDLDRGLRNARQSCGSVYFKPILLTPRSPTPPPPDSNDPARSFPVQLKRAFSLKALPFPTRTEVLSGQDRSLAATLRGPFPS